MTVDIAMEKAGGETPGSPEPSFLVTLGDPRVTLVSVHKRWSFRRNPGTRGSAGPVTSEEEGEFSQKVLNGTRGIRSNQVSAIAEGLESRGGGWTGLADGGFSCVPRVRAQGGTAGLGRQGRGESPETESITVLLGFVACF